MKKFNPATLFLIIMLLLLFALMFNLQESFGQTSSTLKAPPVLNKKDIGTSIFPKDMINTADGGFLVGVNTDAFTGDYAGCGKLEENIWLLKYDAHGDLEWKQCYGGSKRDEVYRIEQTADGGYIFTGFTSSIDGDVSGLHGIAYDMWVVKVDSAGVIQWQKCLGGTSTEYGFAIVLTSDNGYVVAGAAESTDGDVTGYHGGYEFDYWVIKLDASGNLLWQKCLGGTDTELGCSVIQLSNGNYCVSGFTASNNGDVSFNHTAQGAAYDIWVVSLDENGNLLWDRPLGGSGQDQVSAARNMVQLSSGNIVVAGYVTYGDGDISGFHSVPDADLPFYGPTDGWLAVLDTSGQLVQQKCVGDFPSDAFNTVDVMPNGDIIATGYTESTEGDGTGNNGQSDMWLVRLSAAGKVKWHCDLGGSKRDYLTAVVVRPNGHLAFCGASESINGDFPRSALLPYSEMDGWLVEMGANPVITLFTDPLSVTKYCLGDSIHVSYTTAGGFAPDNKFYLLLSDFIGDFSNADTLAIVNGTTSGVISAALPDDLPTSDYPTAYNVQINATHPKAQGNVSYYTLDIRCQAPDHLSVSNITTNSATLHWNDLPCAETYLLSYSISNQGNSTAIYLQDTTTIITNLIPDATYKWSVVTVCDSPGVQSTPAVGKKFTTLLRSGVADGISLETLHVNPNPFTQMAAIDFTISKSSAVNLVLTDVSGRMIKTIDKGNFEAGTYSINLSDDGLSRGIYFLSFQTESTTIIKKVIIE